MNIKIKASIPFTEFGANEHLFENAKIEVWASLSKDKLKLDQMSSSNNGSLNENTLNYWMEEIKKSFDSDPEYVIDLITERMSQQEWNDAKYTITEYRNK